MNAARLLLSACCAVLVAGCSNQLAGRSEIVPDLHYSAAVSVAESERRILVTFADRSIGRVAAADPSSYRHRSGDYQSSSFSRRLAQALSRDYGLTFVTDWPVTTVGLHCVVFEVGRDRSLQDVIVQMGKDERVAGVQPLQRFKVLSDPYSQFQPALETMQVLDAHRWSTGKGVTVAVIDTGIDAEHPDLNGQVVGVEDAVGVGSVPGSRDIHGTAVAGLIVALANNDEGIVGVAPGAKLVSYRACWQESAGGPAATCDTFTLAKALNNAIARKPQIINLSLTGPEDPLLGALIKKALEEHIVVVAAAADEPSAAAGFPASVSGVIAVHALREESASQSVTALERDGFFAPGNRVFTTFPQHGYNFISGNSFAAAHVSGVIALMLSLKPDLTTDEIEALLHRSDKATKNSTGQARMIQILNACTAVSRVLPAADCSRKQST